MLLGHWPILGVALGAALLLVSGNALGAKSYPDPRRDVKVGAGPDLLSVRVSDTRTEVAFSVRFAAAPPLRVSAKGNWVDMLLITIDVAPLGPRPTSPGGEWRGADFALGTHGRAQTGMLVRLGRASRDGARSTPLARFPVIARGATLTFSIPKRALGNPRWFAFTVAAAREAADEDGGHGGGLDLLPARGILRYTLTG